MKVTIRKLRSSTKEVMSFVDRGEEVLVTNHGKVCAKIIPVAEDQIAYGKDALFGIWKDKKEVKSVKQYMDKLRSGRYAC